MRRLDSRVLGVMCVLLAVGCQHDLDALFKDTVVDAGKKPSGTGGHQGGSGGVDGSDDDGGAEPASGGKGGGGTGGVDEPSERCEPCPKLASELADHGIDSCCRGIGKAECGLTFGDKAACLPRMAPGREVSICPNETVGALKLQGCCRPDSRCGFETDGPVLGAFGCVAREEIPGDFFSGVDLTPVACTFECKADEDCNGKLTGSFVCTPNPDNGSQRICAKSCNRDADCGRNRICAFGTDTAMNRVNAFCQDPIGQLEPGQECGAAEECSSGVCKQHDSADPLLGGSCTQLCINAGDCLADQTCDSGAIKRPNADAGLPAQEFKICSDKPQK